MHRYLLLLLLVPFGFCQAMEKPEAVAQKKANSKLNPQLFKEVAVNNSRAVVNLIKRGAEVNGRDQKNRIPLHWAAHKGHAEVAALLLAKGASVDARDCNNRTPLHTAADEGHKEVAASLIENGALIEAKDTYSVTPFYLAACKGHKEMVALLLEKGAVVDTRDGNGMTALHRAACTGLVDVATLLIHKGADVEARDTKNNTPLILAAASGHVAIITLLLQMGAELNAKADDGATALFSACAKGHESVVKVLLEKGPLLNEKAKIIGKFSCHFITSEGEIRSQRQEAQVEQLVNEIVNDSATALMIAAQSNYSGIVRMLLDAGSDTEIRDNYGRTALFLATQANNIDVVRMLVQHGAKPNVIDSADNTPLIIAAYFKFHKIVCCLVDALSDEERKDDHAKKALAHAATRRDNKSIRKLLLAGVPRDEALALSDCHALTHDEANNEKVRALLGPFAAEALPTQLRPVSDDEKIWSAEFKEKLGHQIKQVEEKNACGNCGKISLLLCGGCRKVHYCSAECQRSHWITAHKQNCKKVDLKNASDS